MHIGTGVRARLGASCLLTPPRPPPPGTHTGSFSLLSPALATSFSATCALGLLGLCPPLPYVSTF